MPERTAQVGTRRPVFAEMQYFHGFFSETTAVRIRWRTKTKGDGRGAETEENP